MFSSTYALLDVKQGRHALARRIEKGETVKVLIEAEITDIYGHDDGTSREFNCEVTSVTEVVP